jgi:hypothetical protein
MTLLSRVQRGRTPKPPRLLVYGTEGIGKSTFAAGAPRPIFLQTEDGLDEIHCDKFPLATTFDDITNAMTELRQEQHDYETVVIDSLDWLERMIWDRVCQESGVKTIEKADGGFSKGYTPALTFWRDLIAQLNLLRAERSMVVLLIAHAKIEKFEDPESSPYDRFTPRLHKHAAALISEWCDAVLFATRKIRTQSEDAGFGRKRTIAHAIGKDGGERILRCVGGPGCIAKNRYSLTEDLPLSWAAFMTALSATQPQGADTHG